MVQDERIDELEERTEELARRLARLERNLVPRVPVAALRPAAPRTRPRPVPVTAPPPPPAPPQPGPTLEDLVGGRVLAWAGGVAVLVGIVLLFAIAVSHGWIGEGARTLMAGAGALGLGALGVWLQERRQRTDAALAATATSIAALFITVTVATQVYGLVAPVAGILLAAVVGAAATVVAVRWRAQGIGALGIVGALLAPVLAGAPSTASTLALLWIAAAAATAVVVWQRW